MTYRTLNEIRSLDRSNMTLRFNRTAREAGWHIDRPRQVHDRSLALLVAAVICIIFAVLLP